MRMSTWYCWPLPLTVSPRYSLSLLVQFEVNSYCEICDDQSNALHGLDTIGKSDIPIIPAELANVADLALQNKQLHKKYKATSREGWPR